MTRNQRAGKDDRALPRVIYTLNFRRVVSNGFDWDIGHFKAIFAAVCTLLYTTCHPTNCLHFGATAAVPSTGQKHFWTALSLF